MIKRQPKKSPPLDYGPGTSRLPASGVFLLFPLALMIRALCASRWQLVPDEAYYWVWSRHLAAGYLDQSPLIAYVIRLGTLILGNTELGVRLWITVMGIGSAFIIALTTRSIYSDIRATIFVAVALLSSPAIQALGLIATPDTPACFFGAAALAFVLLAFDPYANRPRPGMWIALGICLGLALLSKYTSVLLGVAILAAMISSKEGRAALRTPWPWVAAMIALLIFSPVINWNAQNNWASFRFQLRHGMVPDPSAPTGPATRIATGLRGLANYFLGQSFFLAPILFAMCLLVMVHYWRRFASLDFRLKILLFSGTVPLAFFAMSSLLHRVEANWPIFAYLPLSILIGIYICEKWNSPRKNWAWAGVGLALCVSVGMHLPELVWKFRPDIHVAAWDELYGWRQMGRRLDELSGGSFPVYTDTYQNASEASFYMLGQPTVWPLPGHGRPTAFDYFPDLPPLADQRVVVYLAGVPKPGLPPFTPPPDLKSLFPTIEINEWDAYVRGHLVLRRMMVVASR